MLAKPAEEDVGRICPVAKGVGSASLVAVAYPPALHPPALDCELVPPTPVPVPVPVTSTPVPPLFVLGRGIRLSCCSRAITFHDDFTSSWMFSADTRGGGSSTPIGFMEFTLSVLPAC